MVANRMVLQGEPIEIVVDQEKCTDCGRCREVCPLVRYIGFQSINDQYARYLCIECCACLAICPMDAISVGDLVPGPPVDEIPSSYEVLNLIKTRRSIRSFKEQKVKPEHWDNLIEAVKYSPTGHNVQHIDVIIIESPEVLNEISIIGMGLAKRFAGLLNRPLLRPMFKRMMGEHAYLTFARAALFYEQQKEMVEKGDDPILFHAPAVMLFIGPKFETMSQTEADLAAQTVALYAPTLGLGTCYSGIITVAFGGLSRSIAKLVQLPQGYQVFNVLIVGYPKSRHRYIPYRKARNVHYL
ncbi:MAG: 4Fe-4S dicluster domain-containing protein [Planctomycetes bacterium]|nr:4Fe-4S dicluster domain-containing protein [Planctomycetota bacterium]